MGKMKVGVTLGSKICFGAVVLGLVIFLVVMFMYDGNVIGTPGEDVFAIACFLMIFGSLLSVVLLRKNSMENNEKTEADYLNGRISEIFPSKENCEMQMESERCNNVNLRARYKDLKINVLIYLGAFIFFFVISIYFYFPIGIIIIEFNAWKVLSLISFVAFLRASLKLFMEGDSKIAVYYARQLDSNTMKEEIMLSDLRLSKYKIRLEEWKDEE